MLSPSPPISASPCPPLLLRSPNRHLLIPISTHCLRVYSISPFLILVVSPNFLSLLFLFHQEDIQSLSTGSGEKGDDLVRILRELTAVQRKIADLQVELQGRKVMHSEFRIAVHFNLSSIFQILITRNLGLVLVLVRDDVLCSSQAAY